MRLIKWHVDHTQMSLNMPDSCIKKGHYTTSHRPSLNRSSAPWVTPKLFPPYSKVINIVRIVDEHELINFLRDCYTHTYLYILNLIYMLSRRPGDREEEKAREREIFYLQYISAL